MGIDIGGTFTDFVLLNEESGMIQVGKFLTTPKDPAQAVIWGFDEILQTTGIMPDGLSVVIHGTTLVTNTLIERKGVKTGLITTKGFRDILEMGNEIRYELYDLMIERPKPLVPRHLRWGISERVNHEGKVLIEPSLEELQQVAQYFREQRVEAIAVCFLHSYQNSHNENTVLNYLQKNFPEFNISLSSRVAPEIREYERTSTTVANAYVQPLVKKYIRNISNHLETKGFSGSFFIMLSSGGITTAKVAEEFPVRLCESGPAAGALVSCFYAKTLKLNDLISFDMGGTTAKICLIHEGTPSYAREFEVARISRFQKGSGLSLKIPSIEMIEIGAGGGSIGYLDKLGLMKVGPESAGAFPGPACYGFGGHEPTITDAALILGYLNPDFFLGGTMPLYLEKSKRVLREKLADPLGISIEEAAIGMNEVVTENMAMAMRVHIAEKGKDPRKYDLIAFGGAGPIHAFRIAEILKLKKIICPAIAGTLSALGLLVAPMAMDFARSYMARLDNLNWSEINLLFTQMENEAREALLAGGLKADEIQFERKADMRYEGQFYEITSPIPFGLLSSNSLSKIIDEFYQNYERSFGRYLTNYPIQVLTWRLRASSSSPQIKIRYPYISSKSSALKMVRKAYFPSQGEFVDTPVYDRYNLIPGQVLEGPAIIEERESTVVVGFQSRFYIDEYLNLVIMREED